MNKTTIAVNNKHTGEKSNIPDGALSAYCYAFRTAKQQKVPKCGGKVCYYEQSE